MADKSTTELELLITANADKFEKELAAVNKQLDKLKDHKAKAEGIGAGFKSALPDLTKFGLAAGATAIALDFATNSVQAFLSRDRGLAELSAITGIAGEGLDDLSSAATSLSLEFGGPVTDQIESFKGVLSRLGPEFGKSAEAMEMMGRNINTLAIAGGIDAPAAMDALTTSMLQFGVDVSNPIYAASEAARMMNVLAAGAQAGAAEIPQIADAIKQAGVAASAANISFEETNAALQVLAAGGKVGSEAGVALRNVIGLLVKQSGPGAQALAELGTSTEQLGKVLTTQGLNAALELLGDKMEGLSEAERLATLMQLFGTENAAAAGIMLKGADAADGQASALKGLTTAITGTNKANEQAAIINDTMSARWDKVTNALGIAGEKLVEGTSFIVQYTSGIGQFFDATEGLEEEERKLAEEQAKVNEELRKQISFTPGAVASFQKLRDEGSQVVDVYLKGRNAINALNAALQAAAAAPKGEEAKTTLEELEAQIAGFKEAQKKATDRTEWLSYEKQIEATQKKIEKITGTQARTQTRTSGKSPLELENEAFDKARIGIAKLHNEWTGFADAVDITAAQMQDVGGAQLVDSLEEQDTIVNRLIVGYGSLGLTIGSVADLFTSAFSGGGDALTGVLKQMGNMFITFVEGAILAGSAFASVSAILTAGISAIKDAPLLAAAIIALEAGRGYINSLAVGTTNVPHDQLAMVHRGESVIPRTFNEGIQRGEMALVGRGKAESPSQTIRQQRAGAFDVTARIDESGFRSVSSRDTYRRGARTF